VYLLSLISISYVLGREREREGGTYKLRLIQLESKWGSKSWFERRVPLPSKYESRHILPFHAWEWALYGLRRRVRELDRIIQLRREWGLLRNYCPWREGLVGAEKGERRKADLRGNDEFYSCTESLSDRWWNGVQPNDPNFPSISNLRGGRWEGRNVRLQYYRR